MSRVSARYFAFNCNQRSKADPFETRSGFVTLTSIYMPYIFCMLAAPVRNRSSSWHRAIWRLPVKDLAQFFILGIGAHLVDPKSSKAHPRTNCAQAAISAIYQRVREVCPSANKLVPPADTELLPPLLACEDVCETNRLKTFAGWPLPSPSPFELAEAGLLWDPDKKGSNPYRLRYFAPQQGKPAFQNNPEHSSFAKFLASKTALQDSTLNVPLGRAINAGPCETVQCLPDADMGEMSISHMSADAVGWLLTCSEDDTVTLWSSYQRLMKVNYFNCREDAAEPRYDGMYDDLSGRDSGEELTESDADEGSDGPLVGVHLVSQSCPLSSLAVMSVFASEGMGPHARVYLLERDHDALVTTSGSEQRNASEKSFASIASMTSLPSTMSSFDSDGIDSYALQLNCAVCKALFPNRASLSAHVRMHHPEIISSPDYQTLQDARYIDLVEIPLFEVLGTCYQLHSVDTNGDPCAALYAVGVDDNLIPSVAVADLTPFLSALRTTSGNLADILREIEWSACAYEFERLLDLGDTWTCDAASSKVLAVPDHLAGDLVVLGAGGRHLSVLCTAGNEDGRVLREHSFVVRAVDVTIAANGNAVGVLLCDGSLKIIPLDAARNPAPTATAATTALATRTDTRSLAVPSVPMLDVLEHTLESVASRRVEVSSAHANCAGMVRVSHPKTVAKQATVVFQPETFPIAPGEPGQRAVALTLRLSGPHFVTQIKLEYQFVKARKEWPTAHVSFLQHNDQVPWMPTTIKSDAAKCGASKKESSSKKHEFSDPHLNTTATSSIDIKLVWKYTGANGTPDLSAVRVTLLGCSKLHASRFPYAVPRALVFDAAHFDAFFGRILPLVHSRDTKLGERNTALRLLEFLVTDRPTNQFSNILIKKCNFEVLMEVGILMRDHPGGARAYFLLRSLISTNSKSLQKIAAACMALLPRVTETCVSAHRLFEYFDLLRRVAEKSADLKMGVLGACCNSLQQACEKYFGLVASMQGVPELRHQAYSLVLEPGWFTLPPDLGGYDAQLKPTMFGLSGPVQITPVSKGNGCVQIQPPLSFLTPLLEQEHSVTFRSMAQTVWKLDLPSLVTHVRFRICSKTYAVRARLCSGNDNMMGSRYTVFENQINAGSLETRFAVPARAQSSTCLYLELTAIPSPKAAAMSTAAALSAKPGQRASMKADRSHTVAFTVFGHAVLEESPDGPEGQQLTAQVVQHYSNLVATDQQAQAELSRCQASLGSLLGLHDGAPSIRASNSTLVDEGIFACRRSLAQAYCARWSLRRLVEQNGEAGMFAGVDVPQLPHCPIDKCKNVIERVSSLILILSQEPKDKDGRSAESAALRDHLPFDAILRLFRLLHIADSDVLRVTITRLLEQCKLEQRGWARFLVENMRQFFSNGKRSPAVYSLLKDMSANRTQPISGSCHDPLLLEICRVVGVPFALDEGYDPQLLEWSLRLFVDVLPSSKAPPKKAPENDDDFQIGIQADRDEPIFFRLKPTTRMAFLFTEYIELRRLCSPKVNFWFEGQSLDPSMTPSSAGMRHRSVVQVREKRVRRRINNDRLSVPVSGTGGGVWHRVLSFRRLQVFATPDHDSNIIRHLDRGDRIRVVDRHNDWLRFDHVAYSGLGELALGWTQTMRGWVRCPENHIHLICREGYGSDSTLVVNINVAKLDLDEETGSSAESRTVALEQVTREQTVCGILRRYTEDHGHEASSLAVFYSGNRVYGHQTLASIDFKSGEQLHLHWLSRCQYAPPEYIVLMCRTTETEPLSQVCKPHEDDLCIKIARSSPMCNVREMFCEYEIIRRSLVVHPEEIILKTGTNKVVTPCDTPADLDLADMEVIFVQRITNGDAFACGADSCELVAADEPIDVDTNVPDASFMNKAESFADIEMVNSGGEYIVPAQLFGLLSHKSVSDPIQNNVFHLIVHVLSLVVNTAGMTSLCGVLNHSEMDPFLDRLSAFDDEGSALQDAVSSVLHRISSRIRSVHAGAQDNDDMIPSVINPHPLSRFYKMLCERVDTTLSLEPAQLAPHHVSRVTFLLELMFPRWGSDAEQSSALHPDHNLRLEASAVDGVSMSCSTCNAQLGDDLKYCCSSGCPFVVCHHCLPIQTPDLAMGFVTHDIVNRLFKFAREMWELIPSDSSLVSLLLQIPRLTDCKSLIDSESLWFVISAVSSCGNPAMVRHVSRLANHLLSQPSSAALARRRILSVVQDMIAKPGPRARNVLKSLLQCLSDSLSRTSAGPMQWTTLNIRALLEIVTMAARQRLTMANLSNQNTLVSGDLEKFIAMTCNVTISALDLLPAGTYLWSVQKDRPFYLIVNILMTFLKQSADQQNKTMVRDGGGSGSGNDAAHTDSSSGTYAQRAVARLLFKVAHQAEVIEFQNLALSLFSTAGHAKSSKSCLIGLLLSLIDSSSTAVALVNESGILRLVNHFLTSPPTDAANDTSDVMWLQIPGKRYASNVPVGQSSAQLVSSGLEILAAICHYNAGSIAIANHSLAHHLIEKIVTHMSHHSTLAESVLTTLSSAHEDLALKTINVIMGGPKTYFADEVMSRVVRSIMQSCQSKSLGSLWVEYSFGMFKSSPASSLALFRPCLQTLRDLARVPSMCSYLLAAGTVEVTMQWLRELFVAYPVACDTLPTSQVMLEKIWQQNLGYGADSFAGTPRVHSTDDASPPTTKSHRTSCYFALGTRVRATADRNSIFAGSLGTFISESSGVLWDKNSRKAVLFPAECLEPVDAATGRVFGRQSIVASRRTVPGAADWTEQHESCLGQVVIVLTSNDDNSVCEILTPLGRVNIAREALVNLQTLEDLPKQISNTASMLLIAGVLVDLIVANPQSVEQVVCTILRPGSADEDAKLGNAPTFGQAESWLLGILASASERVTTYLIGQSFIQTAAGKLNKLLSAGNEGDLSWLRFCALVSARKEVCECIAKTVSVPALMHFGEICVDGVASDTTDVVDVGPELAGRCRHYLEKLFVNFFKHIPTFANDFLAATKKVKAPFPVVFADLLRRSSNTIKVHLHVTSPEASQVPCVPREWVSETGFVSLFDGLQLDVPAHITVAEMRNILYPRIEEASEKELTTVVPQANDEPTDTSSAPRITSRQGVLFVDNECYKVGSRILLATEFDTPLVCVVRAIFLHELWVEMAVELNGTTKASTPRLRMISIPELQSDRGTISLSGETTAGHRPVCMDHVQLRHVAEAGTNKSGFVDVHLTSRKGPDCNTNSTLQVMFRFNTTTEALWDNHGAGTPRCSSVLPTNVLAAELLPSGCLSLLLEEGRRLLQRFQTDELAAAEVYSPTVKRLVFLKQSGATCAEWDAWLEHVRRYGCVNKFFDFFFADAECRTSFLIVTGLSVRQFSESPVPLLPSLDRVMARLLEHGVPVQQASIRPILYSTLGRLTIDAAAVDVVAPQRYRVADGDQALTWVGDGAVLNDEGMFELTPLATSSDDNTDTSSSSGASIDYDGGDEQTINSIHNDGNPVSLPFHQLNRSSYPRHATSPYENSQASDNNGQASWMKPSSLLTTSEPVLGSFPSDFYFEVVATGKPSVQPWVGLRTQMTVKADPSDEILSGFWYGGADRSIRHYGSSLAVPTARLGSACVWGCGWNRSGGFVYFTDSGTVVGAVSIGKRHIALYPSIVGAGKVVVKIRHEAPFCMADETRSRLCRKALQAEHLMLGSTAPQHHSGTKALNSPSTAAEAATSLASAKASSHEQELFHLITFLCTLLTPREGWVASDHKAVQSTEKAAGGGSQSLGSLLPEFGTMLENCNIVLFLKSQLNGSILEMSEKSYFVELLRLVGLLASIEGVQDVVAKMRDVCDTNKQLAHRFLNLSDSSSNSEEGAGKLARAIIATAETVLASTRPAKGETTTDTQSGSASDHTGSSDTADGIVISNDSSSDKYSETMALMRLEGVDILNQAEHMHSGEVEMQGHAPPETVRRIMHEISNLNESLPCQATHAFFVRFDQHHCEFMKILITGVQDTPYAHGCYVFDVYCDPNFPTKPPRVLLETTGSNVVRFNPNLYKDGKVCLSLLGTWKGVSSELWSKSSTLLQVCTSIQSMIMTASPIENEPGEADKQGAGSRNLGYCNIIRYATVKHAMLQQLQSPSSVFASAIKHHFWLLKDQVLATCDTWLKEARAQPDMPAEELYGGIVSLHNPQLAQRFAASGSAYHDALAKVVAELRRELETMEEPALPTDSDSDSDSEDSDSDGD